MNLKRWVMATLGAFGVIAIGDTVIHRCWLGGFYRANPQWWRPAEQMQSLVGVMVAGELFLAAILVFLYAKGYEAGKGTLGQGFRFGLLMGLLLLVPSLLMKHVVYPYPVPLLLNWFIGGLIQIVLTGIMIGYLYKPGK